mmetsp:Transcript_18287/g.41356  ORF Transcript_18287/g.41356 Transcript_18287/m.41356 type:complete len:355 (-) Transcript_18287:32-1096(-)
MRAFAAIAAALVGHRSCQALTLRGTEDQVALDGAGDASGMESGLLDEELLQTVKRHAGLYVNKFVHPEFARTLLITASNEAYAPMLKNWRCHADKLGLDYVIIAFDEQLVKDLAGDERVMHMEGTNFPEHSTFRQGHFNEMSCLKIRVVKEIMAKTGLNIVFSDPDNVFRGDPFAQNVSLGQKMRSGKYEYIYQQNHGPRSMPNSSDIGATVSEANTGFYFVSGTRKKSGVQGLFQAALTECSRHHNIDDQTNFWQALKTIRSGQGQEEYGPGNFACANLCGQGKSCAAFEENVMNYCEMDPWNHATGWDLQFKGDKDIVTYHGNFINGPMSNKIGKISRAGFWDQHCVGPVPP